VNSAGRPARWKILLAFFIIYFVWGSTYLGIRVGVREVPPFLLAAARFTLAGAVLYGWMRLKGAPSPTAKEWRAAFLLGTLMFLIDYGSLFWAEQRVPSGLAAVILASIPLFITLLEIAVLRPQRLSARLAVGLVVKSVSLGEAPLDRAGAVAILVAALGWSAGTILTRRLTLPSSKAMSAAAQMLLGGLQLFVLAAVSGEFAGFHPLQVSPIAWFALLYLIVFGSLIGFTAYVWLLHYESPTMVGTYAYVNPVVAVAIGHFLGGESIGSRTLLGTLLVLASVLMITMLPGKPSEGAIQVESTGGEKEVALKTSD
jgi:drug/metabolite transporter (DMT)-like permease